MEKEDSRIDKRGVAIFSQNEANRDGREERENRGRLSEGAGDRKVKQTKRHKVRWREAEYEVLLSAFERKLFETERAGEKCPFTTYAALTLRRRVFLQIQPSVTGSFLESRASQHNRDAAMSMNALLREAPHNY